MKTEIELISLEELRKRGQVIDYPNPRGFVMYPEKEGRKCNWCKTCFHNNIDMNLHLKAYGKYPHDEEELEKLHRIRWKPSDYDDGDICHVDKIKALDPQLAHAIEIGSVNLGNYTYSLSQNEKWVKRRRQEI